MAKVAEQYFVVKVSKLVKNDASSDLEVLNEDTLNAVVDVVQQLVNEEDDGCIVEVETGE